jgi:hypothetical protein
VGEAFSPSVARSLEPSEAADIAAVAKGLPPTWCVQLLPPHGQMAIVPLASRVRSPRIWTAAPAWGVIRHEAWRPGV